jgi:hypothetical protein
VSELRCKPGDLAVVINAKYRCNLGLIVRVIELHNRKGNICYPRDTPAWYAESQRRMTWVVDGKRYRRKRGPVPDAQLQPIRGNLKGKDIAKGLESPIVRSSSLAELQTSK